MVVGFVQEVGSSYSDSKLAIQLAVNHVLHERTKHNEIDYYFIRDKIKGGLVETTYVPTHHKLADLLIKRLIQARHLYLLGKLGLLNILHPTA